jgi:hypothetical protein
LLSFFVSALLVIIWWVKFGHTLLSVTLTLRAHRRHDGSARQTRFRLYQQLGRVKAVYYLFTMLSDTLMASIVSSLIRTMDCTKQEDGSMTLDAYPEWYCWGEAPSDIASMLPPSTGSAAGYTETVITGYTDMPELVMQPLLASCSLLLLLYYIPSATILAPLLIVDADGVFQPDDLDVRFSPHYLLTENSANLALCVGTIFFGHMYPSAVLTFQFAIFITLWYVNRTWKPCSILVVNYAKTACFALSAFSSFCLVVDVNIRVDWFPFVFISIGIAGIGATAIVHTRHVFAARHGNVIGKIASSDTVSANPNSFAYIVQDAGIPWYNGVYLPFDTYRGQPRFKQEGVTTPLFIRAAGVDEAGKRYHGDPTAAPQMGWAMSSMNVQSSTKDYWTYFCPQLTGVGLRSVVGREWESHRKCKCQPPRKHGERCSRCAPSVRRVRYSGGERDRQTEESAFNASRNNVYQFNQSASFRGWDHRLTQVQVVFASRLMPGLRPAFEIFEEMTFEHHEHRQEIRKLNDRVRAAHVIDDSSSGSGGGHPRYASAGGGGGGDAAAASFPGALVSLQTESRRWKMDDKVPILALVPSMVPVIRVLQSALKSQHTIILEQLETIELPFVRFEEGKVLATMGERDLAMYIIVQGRIGFRFDSEQSPTYERSAGYYFGNAAADLDKAGVELTTENIRVDSSSSRGAVDCDERLSTATAMQGGAICLRVTADAVRDLRKVASGSGLLGDRGVFYEGKYADEDTFKLFPWKQSRIIALDCEYTMDDITRIQMPYQTIMDSDARAMSKAGWKQHTYKLKLKPQEQIVGCALQFRPGQREAVGIKLTTQSAKAPSQDREREFDAGSSAQYHREFREWRAGDFDSSSIRCPLVEVPHPTHVALPKRVLGFHGRFGNAGLTELGLVWQDVVEQARVQPNVLSQVRTWYWRHYLSAMMVTMIAVGFGLPQPGAALDALKVSLCDDTTSLSPPAPNGTSIESSCKQNDMKIVSTICVMLIFVISGLGITHEDIDRAIRQWKGILYSVSSINFLTPLMGLAAMQLPFHPKELAVGVAVFCCMPTTLSSGAVIADDAKGDRVLAVLLSAGTNTLAIFTMPPFLKMVLSIDNTISIDIMPMLLKLCVCILLPMCVGKALRCSSTLVQLRSTHKLVFRNLSSTFLVMIP